MTLCHLRMSSPGYLGKVSMLSKFISFQSKHTLCLGLLIALGKCSMELRPTAKMLHGVTPHCKNGLWSYASLSTHPWSYAPLSKWPVELRPIVKTSCGVMPHCQNIAISFNRLWSISLVLLKREHCFCNQTVLLALRYIL